MGVENSQELISSLTENDHGIERVVEEGKLPEFLSEKLTSYKEILPDAALELMGKDLSGIKNYEVEVTENPYVPGRVEVVEQGLTESGPIYRRVTMYDDRYKPESEFDTIRPGDLRVGVILNSGSVDEISTSVYMRSDGRAEHDTRCLPFVAVKYGLMPDAKSSFWRYVERNGDNPYWVNDKVKQSITLDSDGNSHTSMRWREEYRVPGHRDEYRLKEVEQIDGKVSVGYMTHGISLGNHPEMRVVEAE